MGDTYDCRVSCGRETRGPAGDQNGGVAGPAGQGFPLPGSGEGVPAVIPGTQGRGHGGFVAP